MMLSNSDTRECRLPHLADHLTHLVTWDSAVQSREVELYQLGLRGVEHSRVFWSWSYLVQVRQ